MNTRTIMHRDYNRSRSASYIKVLFGAVIALILLVVLVPLMLNHRPKGTVKKPSADKGLFMAEIPKGARPPLLPESTPSVPAPSEPMPRGSSPGGMADVRPSAPEPTVLPAPVEKPAETLPVGKNPRQAADLTYSTRSAGNMPAPAPVPDRPAKAPAAPAPPDTSKSKVSATVSQTAKPTVVASIPPVVKPKPVPAEPPPAKEEKPKTAKSAQPKGGQHYIIQIGSFQSKQNAETLLENLKKKGYSVVMKPHMHQKLGQMYFVQTEPVDNLDRANTLKTCIERDEKAKPMLLKVGQEQ